MKDIEREYLQLLIKVEKNSSNKFCPATLGWKKYEDRSTHCKYGFHDLPYKHSMGCMFSKEGCLCGKERYEYLCLK